MEPLTNPLHPTPPGLLADRVIVVIDDDTALLALLRTYLGRAGAIVHVAANGREALGLIETLRATATSVHAVLCDLRMQGGSGMEFYRRVSELVPTLAARMIFSSGDLDSDDVRSFIAESGVPVLAKPFPLADLRRMLAALPPPA